mgnify:FL=1
MRYKPKQLLFIEDEVVASYFNNGVKATVSMNYKLYKEEKIPYRQLYFAVLRHIKAGQSTIKSTDELQEIFNRKEYYKTNQNIYGDYYENKIFNSDNG